MNLLISYSRLTREQVVRHFAMKASQLLLAPLSARTEHDASHGLSRLEEAAAKLQSYKATKLGTR